MPEYVHLIGTEKISNAAFEMTMAAGVIERAVREFSESVMRMERALQEDREVRAARAKGEDRE